MNLVEIDIVGAKPRKAVLDGIHDVTARQAHRVGSGTGASPHLGGDDHILARNAHILDRAAQDPLRLAFRIDVGRVDEIDAGIDGLTEQIVGRRLIDLSDDRPQLAAAAESHGAEADFRNEKAGAAQWLIFHCNSILAI